MSRSQKENLDKVRRLMEAMERFVDAKINHHHDQSTASPGDSCGGLAFWDEVDVSRGALQDMITDIFTEEA